MLTENTSKKVFKAGVSSVTILKDLTTGKMRVAFEMPTQLGSIQQIDEIIEVLTEAKEEVGNDHGATHEDQASEPTGSDDSDAQS